MAKIMKSILIFLITVLSIPYMAEAELKIPVGASITVYRRTVHSGTNLFERKGAFEAPGVIKAVKSPFGDGGVNGWAV